MPIALVDLPETRVNLQPLTFLKPISDLRVGIQTIKEKWMRWLPEKPTIISAEYLNLQANTPFSGLAIASNLFPNQELVEACLNLKEGQVLVQEGFTIAAVVTEFENGPIDQKEARAIPFEGKIHKIEFPWDIFHQNGQQIREDFERITTGRISQKLSDPFTRIYGNQVFLEEGAQIKAAILNAENGPIYIGKNATVHEGAMIRGPFALGEQGQINMGAKIRGDATVGPYCKVGGEYSNSIMMGYSNKGHDGFLGNSVIGEWCNLGADTNNSNLKNNYGPVKMWSYEKNRYVDTGLQFCGLIMGDHSKCAINTMFNTGTVVGMAANLFGIDFHKKFVPSFSWGGRNHYSTYQLAKAYETMDLVMSRRGQKLDEKAKNAVAHVFEITAPYRK